MLLVRPLSNILHVQQEDYKTSRDVPADKVSLDNGTTGNYDEQDSTAVTGLQEERYRTPESRLRPNGMLRFAGREVGAVGSTTGLVLLSKEGQEWIQSKSGVSFSTESLYMDRFRDSYTLIPESPPEILRSIGTHDIGLPNQAIVEQCVDAYQKCSLRMIFPVLDPILFVESIRIAYHAPNNGLSGISGRTCILSFLVLASFFEFGPSAYSPAQARSHTGMVQQVLPTIIETVTLETFQTCVMLLVFQFYSGNTTSATITNSLAAQLAFMLGGHTQPRLISMEDEHQGITCRTQRHLRSLFWICYTIDKELSFRIRQPPALPDEYCDLTFSAEYLAQLSVDLSTGVPSQRIHPCRLFPTDIKLSQIKSRAFKLLYSASAAQKTNAELLMAVRHLDDDLETWRIAIPEDLRPSISSESLSHPRNIDTRSLILRLEYHHCVTVIHQATSRCVALDTVPHGVRTGILSSAILAVGASRLSLRYLQISHHILNRGSFCILEHADEPLATSDLDLLRNVPQLISRMPVHHLTPADILYIEQLDQFVQELSRVAQSALRNARRRQQDEIS
ncbi:hypothetical protein ASPFODRAFT_38413 [Aspergillus luchuensis CBS 106.47]|uniref:Xylanolytic transcriptional activator regulatory domain-containing protein n=1 Tax=Aspergillus luchuensis (strain CBS 106.47) TaxID=1137211 RepID=A0A1M3T0A6_ASPLC|nr:hypothetical protein ASPFODRAFT_38413 [Aspergillus luchuensis CBS 106.47]